VYGRKTIDKKVNFREIKIQTGNIL